MSKLKCPYYNRCRYAYGPPICEGSRFLRCRHYWKYTSRVLEAGVIPG